MLLDLLWLFLGLGILVMSGEVLVKGAVAIAFRFRVSTLVVGMTIVSLGTSAPELLVSLKAALSGHQDISIGNVLGSNISNFGLVLGLTVLIFPIMVDNNSIRLDWPAMMIATLILTAFMYDLQLERWEGGLMFLLLVGYITFLIVSSRKKNMVPPSVDDGDVRRVQQDGSIWKFLLFVLIGCGGLLLGSDWFLFGAVNIAQFLGVSEHVIAVTLVAFGTSVPELFTSGIAAFRKEPDISVGNLIGSNLFNILAILGITSIVSPIEVNERVMNSDIYWVIAISVIIFPMMLWGKRLLRIDGGILLLIYIAYIYFVVSSVVS